MKALVVVWTLFSPGAFCQVIDTISVSLDKTVYVLLESEVALVDLGTKVDYAYLVKENIVMLKALKETAKPTSLMIKTSADLYVWIIRYRKELNNLIIKPQQKTKPPVGAPANGVIEGPIVNQINIGQQERDAEASNDTITRKGNAAGEEYLLAEQPLLVRNRSLIGNRDVKLKDELMQGKVYSFINEKPKFRDLGEIGNGIYFALQGICVDTQYIYMKMSLFNTSSIAFDLDVVYFERQQGRSFKKREAISNIAIPVVFRESVFTVQPSSEEVVVFVLSLFAYQEKDKILVKVNERGGVRSLQFYIPAKEIINAKPL